MSKASDFHVLGLDESSSDSQATDTQAGDDAPASGGTQASKGAQEARVEHRHQESFEGSNLDFTVLAAGEESQNVVPHPSMQANSAGGRASKAAAFKEDDSQLLHQEQVQMLHQLNSLILQPIPFEQLVGFLLSIVTAAVKGTVASVLELDQQRQEFFFRSSIGGSTDRLRDVRMPASEGIAGYVAANKGVELISDVNEDERHMAAISHLAGKELSNCVAAAIVINGSLFGVLEIFNKADGSPFTFDDKATVEIALPVVTKILEVRFFAAKVSR